MTRSSFFIAPRVSQVVSKALFPVADQGELTLSRRAEPNDMPIEMVRRQCSVTGRSVQSVKLPQKQGSLFQ